MCSQKYKRLIMKLKHLTITRPNVSFALKRFGKVPNYVLTIVYQECFGKRLIVLPVRLSLDDEVQ